jgi:hypothetical protein
MTILRIDFRISTRVARDTPPVTPMARICKKIVTKPVGAIGGGTPVKIDLGNPSARE